MEESADINCKSPVKDWLIKIEENVKPRLASECSIYRVPENIRRTNADAYTPKVISIGPLHHGKPELADMENWKKIYVKSFLDRIPAEKRQEIITVVQDNEKLLRASYGVTIMFGGSDFVKMIIADALFIIEHFLKTLDGFIIDDGSWLQFPAGVQSAISLDLLLLENQLPYFILKQIFNLLGSNSDVTFLNLSILFFRFAFDFDIHYVPEEPKHFTDLIRTALVESCPTEVPNGPIRDLPCALQLYESGVNFKNSRGKGLLDVRFQKGKLKVSFLRGYELHVPCLTIDDSTECVLRNVMALEQCLQPLDTQVCNYVWLMDSLINNEKDVEFLVAEGIISNLFGDSVQVANMFNKINSHIVRDEKSSYYQCFKELKGHYKNPWRKTKATLGRVYFNNVWRGTATIAAVILLLLSVIQAICSILQVV